MSEAPAGPKHTAVKASVTLMVLLVCGAVALAVWWSLESLASRQRREMASNLVTVLSTTQAALKLWSRELKIDATVLAEQSEIREAVRRQLLVQRDPSALRASPEAGKLRLDSIVKRYGFLGVEVLAPDGTTIASTSQDAIGTKTLARLDPQPLAAALTGTVSLGLPFLHPEAGTAESRPALILAAPVRDAGGAVIAVLAFRLDPGRGLTEQTQLGRIGDTGETYAFDREGRLITESRFDEHLREIGLIGPSQRGILSIAIRDPGGNLVDGFQPPLPRSEQPFTRMAQSAIAGRSGIDMNGYRDYRGVTVVGAWTWDGDLGFGLATEMDKAEAYAVVRSSQRLALFMFGTAVLGTLGLLLPLRAVARRLDMSVSRERRAEASLERHRVKLHQAEAELDAAIRAREEFLRNASHELRTPITSLSLLYQHLLRSVRDKHVAELPPDQVERFLRTSERQFSRLNQLVDNLLDIGKETRSNVTLNLEEVDLADVVRQVAERLREQFTASGSRLDLDLEDNVVGYWDRFRLEHVVTNLLSNAAKYGLGNPIRVEGCREGSIARLCVEDKGMGIAERDLVRVFDRFTRIGPLRPISGLGVGLSISRAIVEAHGGTIRVESTVGRGSTFTVELPMPVALDGTVPSSSSKDLPEGAGSLATTEPPSGAASDRPS
jgi:signal transduction histidine kinase